MHESWIQGEKSSLLSSTLHIMLQMFFSHIFHLCYGIDYIEQGDFDYSHEWYFWVFHIFLKPREPWVLHGGGFYLQLNYCW